MTTAETTTVETTEKAEVKKVELVTESFSTFTIYWSDWRGDNTRSVRIHYTDTNGNDISGRGGVGFETGNDEIDLDSGEYKIAISGYNYQYTTVKSYDNDVRTTRIRRDYNDNIQYRTEWGNWSSIEPNREQVQRPNGEKYWVSYYDIYLVYEYDSSSGDVGEGGQLGAPEHKKYIRENLPGEDYTLTLDVTGERGEKSGVDVLLVIDKSGSMGSNNNDLMGDVQTAVATAVDTVLPDNTSINRIAVTSFSSDDYTGSDISTNWVNYYNKQSVKNEVNALRANGGTNWELGMMKAETLLSERASSGNKKVVIFLSDGCPGYYYLEERGGGLQEVGVGSPSPDGDAARTAREQAAAYVQQTDYLKDATIYSVYLTSDTQSDMDAFTELLKGKNVDAQTVDGTSIGTDLADLINKIVAPQYTNVVIEDVLSEYVELTESPGFKVEAIKDGDVTELTQGSDYTLTEETVILPSGVESTKITVSLLGGAALDDGVTYSLSYHVKPSEAAVTAWIEEGGYLHRGDLETDAPGNNTSSGQLGFYSNDSAVVRYKENEGIGQTAEYDKPVVQIDTGKIDIPETPNPIEGSITKTMGEVTEDGKYPITLEVKTRLEESSEAAKVDVILVIDRSGSMADDNRMTNTKKAAKKFVEGFIGPEGTNSDIHRIGIVTFSSSAEIYDYNSDWWITEHFSGNASEVITAIDAISAPNGGTNTDAGFTKAKDLADESTNNKYVIFLTDGVPTFHDENTQGGGTYSNVSDFNNAVDAAMELEEAVDGIYTIGLLDGADDQEKDIARKLLASDNSEHYHPEYTTTYKLSYSYADTDWWGNVISWEYRWDTTKSYNYSDGYFEVTNSNAETELEDIWTQLATIINNKTSGSTGAGWQVIDTMADYTKFLALEGSEINGYELTVSEDGKTLTTIIDGATIKVAEYNVDNKTITWTLSDVLAEKSIKYNHGTDYTYRLTYYVDFEDSGSTEFRPTNKDTYVIPSENPDSRIYPEKMPFFVNIVGVKLDADSSEALAGAEFKVYKDEDKTTELGTCTTNANGHFAFQLGQTDLLMTSSDGEESYTTNIYLEEITPPEGHVLDGKLHTITISVSNVTYATETTQAVQKGTPQAQSLSVIHACVSTENDVVSINDTLQIQYLNKSKPDWAIVKRNGNNTGQFLEGAEFELYEVVDDITQSTPSYTATSTADGVIAPWTKIGSTGTIQAKDLPVGTYVLKEKTAPTGYRKSEETWTLEITPTSITITSSTGSAVTQLTEEEKAEHGLNEGTTYYAFDNVMLYELPETGGTGIHLYMLGGVALMMAGTLLVYKKRKEEVLRS